MPSTKAFAASAATEPLRPFSFERREPGPTDVELEILFCGVCHSDLHIARNEWGRTTYPCVPGHEIVGHVLRIGNAVTKFREGDRAAVGCMVDSDHTCENCRAGLEQFCKRGATLTYNSEDPHTGGITYGGYSQKIVVDQDFVLRLPETLEPAAAAPLLCAGITTYSHLRTWKIGHGYKAGVVGLGGLGHMGLKFAHAFGAEVTLFTTSEGKKADAERFGADAVIISKDKEAMEREAKSYDFILDTVAAVHDLGPYLSLLKRDGVLVLVGLPPERIALDPFHLIVPRRQLAGSLIGGIAETQEMLDFCAETGISCEIERIAIDQINQAYERMLRRDVRYRFVIDMKSLQ